MYKKRALLAGTFLTASGIRYLYRKCFHRSVRSKAVEESIKLLSHKDALSDQESFQSYLYEKSQVNTQSYKLMRYMMSSVEETTFSNHQLYTLTSNADNDFNILYLHAGGYINQPSFNEWSFIDKLCKDLNAKVYVPLYHLVPSATHEQAYEMIEALYRSLDTTKPTIIMGTGAGGGLAAGFCEGLDPIMAPDQLILISPWVDVTMSNFDILRYESKDPMLASYGLKKLGQMWAGAKSAYAYKVSPLYGDVTSLKNVTIITGTQDILYPDIMKFYHQLVKAHVSTNLIEGKAMIHNYPLLPIPEASEAFKEIVDVLHEK
jgi:acetyl esterase/lipase